MSIRKFQRTVEAVNQRAPVVLAAHGLDASCLRRSVVVEEPDLTLLFLELDVNRILRSGQKLQPYQSPALLHDLSTVLGGKPVLASNSNGLRLAVILSDPPRLPRTAPFSDIERGKLLVGRGRRNTRLAYRWSVLEHMLVAGMTGSGKSSFLRLLVYQALHEGYRLAIADVHSRTFPMLKHHPALLTPLAKLPTNAVRVLDDIGVEIKRRERLFDEVERNGHYPDDVWEYNRIPGVKRLDPILVVLDEYNATVQANGGVNRKFAQLARDLVWTGRKWGVTVIVAGQEFEKKVVGPIREQLGLRLCFRVMSKETSKIVTGSGAAANIPGSRPGRALIAGRGSVQTFHLEKQLLITLAGEAAPGLMEREAWIAQTIRTTNAAKLNIPGLMKQCMMSETEARNLIRDWDARGWAAKDRMRSNARYLTPKVLELLKHAK